MRKDRSGIAAIVIIALALFLPWLRKKFSETSDDRVEVGTTTPFLFRGVEESLATRIRDAINTMGAVGTEAEEQYQDSLERLRSDSQLVVKAIAEELEVLPSSQYLDRWSLIQLLAELRDPASLPVLDDVLSSKMPPERYQDPHARSSLRQETINLTTAVEAVTRIAATENQEAMRLLLKHVDHESLSVRRASVQGYLEYGGDGAREQVLKILPESEHYLLDIRKLGEQEVPSVRARAEEIPSRPDQDKRDVPRITPRRDD